MNNSICTLFDNILIDIHKFKSLHCYYFPLFNLFATFGIYFSASKRWRKQSDKADAEKYARQTERKIFAAHSRRNAGIGKIGAAYYLCGKISPREVARQQQNDNK
jgi:hypothetical protein